MSFAIGSRSDSKDAPGATRLDMQRLRIHLYDRASMPVSHEKAKSIPKGSRLSLMVPENKVAS
jgi:hypothetical protein